MYTHIYFYIPLMIFIDYFQIGHELWLTKFLFNQTVVTLLFCWIFGLFFYTFSAFQIDNFKGPCDFSFRYFILFYFLNFDENYLIICWHCWLLVYLQLSRIPISFYYIQFNSHHLCSIVTKRWTTLYRDHLAMFLSTIGEHIDVSFHSKKVLDTLFSSFKLKMALPRPKQT